MSVKIIVLYSILITLVLTTDGLAQTAIEEGQKEKHLIEAAIEIMHAAETCALITLDNNGTPRVRAMDPFPPDSNLIVWFGSNPQSRKLTQIRNDPRVTLYYLDKDTSGYVMIQGLAEIVDNPSEKQKRWKKKWEAFYPNYPHDYILIKVSPQWMEIISPPRDIPGDPKTWEPQIVKFD